MSAKRTLIKNTALNSITYLYLIIASLISIPILLANLGSSLFGAYTLLISIIALISILDLSIPISVIQKLSLPSSTKTYKHKVWQTALYLALLIGFISSLITFPGIILLQRLQPQLIPYPAHTTIILALIISLNVFINHLTIHFQTLPQSLQKFEVYNLRSLIVGTGATLVSALISNYSPHLTSIFFTQLLTNLLGLIILVRFAKKYLNPITLSPEFNKSTGKKLLNFGLKHFLGKASTQIKHQFSKYALAAFFPISLLPAFSIPQSIIASASGLISQLTLAFFPFSGSLLKKKDFPKLSKITLASQSLIFLGGLTQFILIKTFGRQFLIWWLKDTTIASSAYPVLVILSLFLILSTLTQIPSVVLDSLNLPQIPSSFAVLSAILNITLIIYLTPKLGITGPAYATLITSLVIVPIYLLKFSFIFAKYKKSLHQKQV